MRRRASRWERRAVLSCRCPGSHWLTSLVCATTSMLGAHRPPDRAFQVKGRIAGMHFTAVDQGSGSTAGGDGDIVAAEQTRGLDGRLAIDRDCREALLERHINLGFISS